MQSHDIIARKGKIIYINSKALVIQKPTESINGIASVLANMSNYLAAEEWFGEAVSKEKIVSFIQEHFTVCWEYFYRFQISYLTRHRAAFGDLENWNVWGSIAIVQVSTYTESLVAITREELSTYEDFYMSMLKFKCERGINASSIADISGIPRATVIRKLRTLEKKDFIKRNKKLEYTLGQAKNLKAFQTNYLINQKNLSDFCTTLFNLMKNSKFKIN